MGAGHDGELGAVPCPGSDSRRRAVARPGRNLGVPLRTDGRTSPRASPTVSADVKKGSWAPLFAPTIAIGAPPPCSAVPSCVIEASL